MNLSASLFIFESDFIIKILHLNYRNESKRLDLKLKLAR
jgi:hypothetical protein